MGAVLFLTTPHNFYKNRFTPTPHHTYWVTHLEGKPWLWCSHEESRHTWSTPNSTVVTATNPQGFFLQFAFVFGAPLGRTFCAWRPVRCKTWNHRLTNLNESCIWGALFERYLHRLLVSCCLPTAWFTKKSALWLLYIGKEARLGWPS